MRELTPTNHTAAADTGSRLVSHTDNDKVPKSALIGRNLRPSTNRYLFTACRRYKAKGSFTPYLMRCGAARHRSAYSNACGVSGDCGDARNGAPQRTATHRDASPRTRSVEKEPQVIYDPFNYAQCGRPLGGWGRLKTRERKTRHHRKCRGGKCEKGKLDTKPQGWKTREDMSKSYTKTESSQ